MVGPGPDDRAYRRGLVLGWSLAEVFVLIVFALLFAFAAVTVKVQKPIAGAKRQPHPRSNSTERA
jgi:hypothetical protein